jgi:hypothetical protein
MRFWMKPVFILLAVVVFSGCIQLKTRTLYDGVRMEPKPPKPTSISALVEPIIFQDDASDVWGMEDTGCTNGKISTDVVHTGERAIFVEWDRNAPGCIFSGIGIGWDGYAGKDLSEIFDYAAIEFYVRSKEGKMFGLPIVLTLEDYSGGMGFSYTGNKYFERYYIDEEWQKVVIPLNTFDLETEGLDLTNIKQLQLELQQSGSIYLDDMRLVFYEEPEAEESWMVEATRPDPLAFPKVLFDDSFINDDGWGLVDQECKSIKLESAADRGKVIHATWDATDGRCSYFEMGISWNQWFPVDMSSVKSTSFIEMEIKTSGKKVNELPVAVAVEDYDRAVSRVKLDGDFSANGVFSSDWQTVRIPFTALAGNANFSRIKQLFFEFSGAGEVYMDQIRLVGE